MRSYKNFAQQQGLSDQSSVAGPYSCLLTTKAFICLSISWLQALCLCTHIYHHAYMVIRVALKCGKKLLAYRFLKFQATTSISVRNQQNQKFNFESHGCCSCSGKNIPQMSLRNLRNRTDCHGNGERHGSSQLVTYMRYIWRLFKPVKDWY